MLFKLLYQRYAERVKPLEAEPVEVQVMSIGSIDILRAFDISLKGIGIRSPQKYEIDQKEERVDLIITLPGAKPFKASGIVRHITNRPNKDLCFGIEFTNIGKNSLGDIREYMENIKLKRTQLAC